MEAIHVPVPPDLPTGLQADASVEANYEDEERVVMSEGERSIHLGFMREALAMGELALETDETPVGCVFVYQGNIIGRGMNATNRTMNGTRHAEFVAINEILSTPFKDSKASSEKEVLKVENGKLDRKYGPDVLKECDLYVTVEPCIMCASLLRQFGIRKVYYGATNEKFGGTGGVLNIHEGNGVTVRNGGEDQKMEGDYEVSGGWLREEAIILLRRFYVQENGKAPEPKKRKDRTVKLEVEPMAK